MDTVMVTGSTGHLGRDIVPQLQQRNYRVRILARTPGQDPAIDWIRGIWPPAKASPRRSPAPTPSCTPPRCHRPRSVAGSGRATSSAAPRCGRPGHAAAARRGHPGRAAHFLYMSIVGVQASRIPYSRVKAAAEDLVRQAELAWSIVPATGFYWLLGRFLDNLADRRIWPLPTNLPMQPVDSTDFAAYVGECVAAGPGAEREGFGGPEILTPAPASPSSISTPAASTAESCACGCPPPPSARPGRRPARTAATARPPGPNGLSNGQRIRPCHERGRIPATRELPYGSAPHKFVGGRTAAGRLDASTPR